MDMKIDSNVIVTLRKHKAWSQQHLADVAELSLRTVQRIENDGTGSPESVKAVAQALDKVPGDLMQKVVEAPSHVADNVLHTEPVIHNKALKWYAAVVAAFIAIVMPIWLTAGAQDGEQIGVNASEQHEAEAAAQHWFILLDSDDFQASWKSLDDSVKLLVTSTAWKQAVENARQRFGRVENRAVANVTFTNSLPNLPTGKYVIIEYTSTVVGEDNRVETLPMVKSGGAWRPIGYFIR